MPSIPKIRRKDVGEDVDMAIQRLVSSSHPFDFLKMCIDPILKVQAANWDPVRAR